MTSLIVNGDDFGLCAAVNQGIVQAFCKGILTSTSIMANAAGFDEACGLSHLHPELAVGLHITLTCGRPIGPASSVSSLVDRQGRFYRKLAFIRRALTGALDAEQVEIEVRSQLQMAVNAGLTITHLDTHHHVHCLPVIGRVVALLAQEWQVPVRRTFIGSRPYGSVQAFLQQSLWQAGVSAGRLSRVSQPPCRFVGIDYMYSENKKPALMDLIDHLPEGLSELMCHPATADVDQALPHDRLARFADLQALCDPQIRLALIKRKVRLVSGVDLKRRAN